MSNKLLPCLIIAVLGIFCSANALTAQRASKYKDRLEELRNEDWPPQRVYSRISLGYALQRIFKKHTDYCGFSISDTKRDFVPADMSKFLGKRDLRTKVETADIRGGGLLNYIFTYDETQRPFSDINYSQSKVFTSNGIPNQFLIDPDENFDSFILTKNCSGYLKASLDAGIEPPYSAFKTALATDDRRESNVVAVSGSFLSPLKIAFESNDWRSNEAMMQLWRFYRDNPEYVNKAYYLREFEGVMVKHITTAEENRKWDAEVGVNVSLPFSAKISNKFGKGKSSSNSFNGTDWETIVYADFNPDYTRSMLFTPLPSPTQIAAYFSAQRPDVQLSKDFPLMSESAEHRHSFSVDGIPREMTDNFWMLENVRPGVYQGSPELRTESYGDPANGNFGCKFTVTGRPLSEHFTGPLGTRPDRIKVAYQVRSRYPVGGEYIRFYIEEDIPTSAHPIATLNNGYFDLTKKEDRRFAFQWTFSVDLEDYENPVDYATLPEVSRLVVQRNEQQISVRLANIRCDAPRRQYWLTVESLDTYPLDLIDDQHMINYNLSFEFLLQTKRGMSKASRPISGRLSFPSIKPPPPPAIIPEIPAVAPEKG
ncbi:MAG: hypothetical protein KDD12_01430 [Lewinella sp.]|nr:hypothetical protein [Lewinella sp.]